jgi:hypothetical protein
MTGPWGSIPGMRKTIVLVGLVVLVVAGLSAPASAAGRSSGKITISTATAEQGKKAAVRGSAKKARRGTKVVVQKRASAKENWVKAGSTRVRGSGRFTFRPSTRRAGSTTYRACIGTGAARRCSNTARLRVLLPDGDVVVTSWSAVTEPSENPVTARFGGNIAPLHVEGTSDPASRAALADDGMVIQQKRSGRWESVAEGSVVISRSGRWTFDGAMYAVGDRRAPLRVAIGRGASSSVLRTTTTREFTTTSLKDIRVQDFARTSGTTVSRDFVELVGSTPRVSTTVSPVGDSSVTYDLGGYCTRLHDRVGLAPGGPATDLMTATVTGDGTTLVSTTVAPTAASSAFGGVLRVSPLAGVRSLTLADATAPGATGSDVFFDAFARCAF